MNQLDEPTTGIYIPNDIFTKAQDFIDYSKERDRLNEEEDWDGAFEVECAQRDIGLDIAIWIKGLEERIDV
ncbi:MAG: hypothetical protein DRN17_05640 [Thermoplasmata archaeon]|nr:MAG: hypothetical protein DRN17_05640 [Thermoplasmata archaeon]